MQAATMQRIFDYEKEIIRWQTPLTQMRRTTTREVQVRGVTIPAGAKVAMCYLSGNRDEQVIEKACSLLIGAGKRTRTSDQLLTKQLLYQLSYSG
jgi:hypothetical protein